MAKQLTIVGTDVKYTKAMVKAGDALTEAIKTESTAKSERKDRHAEALAQMENDGIELYVDREADPPFVLKLNTKKTVKKSAYKAPKQKRVGEDDEEDDTKH